MDGIIAFDKPAPVPALPSSAKQAVVADAGPVTEAEVEQLRLAVFQSEEERRQLQQALSEQQELIEWQAAQLNEERGRTRAEQRRVQELQAQVAALSAPARSEAASTSPSTLNESRISDSGERELGARLGSPRLQHSYSHGGLGKSGVYEVTHSLEDLQQDVHQLASRVVEAEGRVQELQGQLEAALADGDEWKAKYTAVVKEQTMSPGEVGQASQATLQSGRAQELEAQMSEMRGLVDMLQRQQQALLQERDELQGTIDIRDAQLDTLRLQRDKALAEVRSLQDRAMLPPPPSATSPDVPPSVAVQQQQGMLLEDLQGKLKVKRAEVQDLQQSLSAANAALRASDILRKQTVDTTSHSMQGQLESFKHEAQQAQMRAEIYQQEARRAGTRAAELQLELETVKAQRRRSTESNYPLVASLQAEVSSLRQRLVDMRHSSLTGSPSVPGMHTPSPVSSSSMQPGNSQRAEAQVGTSREAELAKLRQVQGQLEEQLAAIRADAEAESKHASRVEVENASLRAAMAEWEERCRVEREQVVALRAQVEVLTRVLTPSKGQALSRTDGDPSVSRLSGESRASPVARAASHGADEDGDGDGSSLDSRDLVDSVPVTSVRAKAVAVPVAKARFHAQRQLARHAGTGRHDEAIHAAVATATSGVYSSSLRRALAEQVGRSRARAAVPASSSPPSTAAPALALRADTGKKPLANHLLAPIQGWYHDARGVDDSIDSEAHV